MKHLVWIGLSTTCSILSKLFENAPPRGSSCFLHRRVKQRPNNKNRSRRERICLLPGKTPFSWIGKKQKDAYEKLQQSSWRSPGQVSSARARLEMTMANPGACDYARWARARTLPVLPDIRGPRYVGGPRDEFGRRSDFTPGNAEALARQRGFEAGGGNESARAGDRGVYPRELALQPGGSVSQSPVTVFNHSGQEWPE